MGPLFNWIHHDLERRILTTPTLIVFQEFERNLDALLWSLDEKLADNANKPNLLAILFTLMTKEASVSEKNCGPEQRQVPVVVFGSLEDDAYVLMQFNPYEKGLKTLFQFDVYENQTVATEYNPETKFCL